jgi:hypothetical protein
MLFIQEGFTYRNFLMDMISIFFFIIWFWLFITIASDLFRRHDISGWFKAIWIIFLIIFPYITVLAYLIVQGRGMAQRDAERSKRAFDDLRQTIGFSVADEIEKLDRLKQSGSISEAEYLHLRARLVQ